MINALLGEERVIAFDLPGTTREAIYVICNAYWEPLDCELPPAPVGGGWRRVLDTSLPSPQDFQELATAPLVPCPTYRAGSRSCILLAAEIFNAEDRKSSDKIL